MSRAIAFIFIVVCYGLACVAAHGAVPVRSVVTYQDGHSQTTQPVWNVRWEFDDNSAPVNSTFPAATRPSVPLLTTVTQMETATSFFSLKGNRQVSNVSLSVPAGKVGFWISGSGNKVLTAAVAGGDKCFYLAHASKATIEGFDATADTFGYSFYLRDGCEDITIRNGTARVAGTGQHAVRIYDTKRLLVEDVTLEHRAAYGGSPLNIKSGSDMTFRRVTTLGHAPGIGHNPVPDEEKYTLANLLFEDCSFTIEQTIGIAIKAGTRDVTFRRCVFVQKTGSECLKVEGAWRTSPAPSGITLENCRMYGTRATPIAGNAAAVELRGVNLYNDKPLVK